MWVADFPNLPTTVSYAQWGVACVSVQQFLNEWMKSLYDKSGIKIMPEIDHSCSEKYTLMTSKYLSGIAFKYF